MEGLDTLFGLLPEQWAAVVGTLLTLAIALRTVLRALVAVCYAIDRIGDGKVNTLWVARFGDFVDWLDDRVFDHLPVKAPLARSKGV